MIDLDEHDDIDHSDWTEITLKDVLKSDSSQIDKNELKANLVADFKENYDQF